MNDYLENFKNKIEAYPYKINYELNVENRADTTSYIKCKIAFINYSELHIKEYVVIIPNHKHISNDVISSKEPSLENILYEISEYMKEARIE